LIREFERSTDAPAPVAVAVVVVVAVAVACILGAASPDVSAKDDVDGWPMLVCWSVGVGVGVGVSSVLPIDTEPALGAIGAPDSTMFVGAAAVTTGAAGSTALFAPAGDATFAEGSGGKPLLRVLNPAFIGIA